MRVRIQLFASGVADRALVDIQGDALEPLSWRAVSLEPGLLDGSYLLTGFDFRPQRANTSTAGPSLLRNLVEQLEWLLARKREQHGNQGKDPDIERFLATLRAVLAEHWLESEATK